MPDTQKVYRNLVIQRRIFLTINVVAALVVGILWYGIRVQSAENHKQNATILKQASQIQHQRRESIMRSCDDQNRRNAKTIQTLDNLIAKFPPKRRAEAEANKVYSVLLINALAPKQNCIKLTKLATGG